MAYDASVVHAPPDRAGNRSELRSADFAKSFVAFSRGKVVSDVNDAPAVEIGRPSGTYRRIRIQSTFGKLATMVTDGHLRYPYARESTGYEVKSLDEMLTKAKSAGVTVLVDPFISEDRRSAMVEFPRGYVAEIHAAVAIGR